MKEIIKKFARTHKQKIIIASSLLLSFVSGFSISALGQGFSASYGNNSAIKPYNQTIRIDKSCPIRAKLNSKKILIYHLPGQSVYSRIKDFECFKTEEEAQEAGYVKAAR